MECSKILFESHLMIRKRWRNATNQKQSSMNGAHPVTHENQRKQQLCCSEPGSESESQSDSAIDFFELRFRPRWFWFRLLSEQL
jgi:hypothetical protein